MAAPAYPPVIKPEDFLDPPENPDTGSPPTAKVARTASDASPLHYNTLVPPNHGIVWLQLTCNGKMSKSYGGTEDKDGSDDFHYASGVEDATVKYKMNNARGGITGAKIQLYRRFDSSPLWERDLTEDEITDGEHSFTFNMGTQTNDKFPDLVPTAEHSPYKLRILVNSERRPQSPLAWTYFQILIKDIKLELGDRDVVPEDSLAVGGVKKGSHRDVYDSFKNALPAEDKTLKVVLLSNLFSTGNADMSDQTSFTTYQTQWGEGPMIPIFAKLRVRKSDDTAVEAPWALGKLRCLWDFEDMKDDTTQLAAPPATFVIRSENFDIGSTHPKGDNCYETRGGKRGASGSSHPIFPNQAGYDDVFPFPVEPASTRDWAALSQAWRTGKYVNKTGVMFRPCRMGGDAYKVTVYVAWEKDKDQKYVLDILDDIKDKVSTDLKAATGTFQIWRRHHINRYIKKHAFAAEIPVPAVQAYYEKAYVDMFKVYNQIDTMTEADYNATITTERTALGALAQAAVDPAINQFTAGDACITYRAYNAFLAALRAAQGWSAAQLNTWLAGSGAGVNTAAKYEKFCDSWGWSFVVSIMDHYLPLTDGVTLTHFVGVHNIGGQGGLNGAAGNVPHATRQRCAFVTCALPNAYTGNANRLEQTTTHEIGHQLFMPHAPDGVSATDPANVPHPEIHDKDDHNCTMSYNFSAERRWCGYCLLRLRGWDKTTIKNDGTQNSHP
ncbi:MAG TPA: hypothetical protein VHQ47_04465 [Phycisphaerae bacterium]|nr:hypothetical protein [Phycisphaerae bacterium]